MRGLAFAGAPRSLEILCLGAHSDDIEIGLGGTLLQLIASGVELKVHWCVVSANGARAAEAEASARDFLKGAAGFSTYLAGFEDSYFPAQSRDIKQWLSRIRKDVAPDVVFTHARDDAHQDHREICGLTWNLFRDHTILEYEIPKWDGDLARQNMYVPLTADVLNRKIALLETHFGTQRSKDWFDAETFSGLARLRGMECRAPERYAEAFNLRKATLLF